MKIYLTPSDSIDAALFRNRLPNTEFHLQKGEYITMGNWLYQDYISLAPNCKLYGNGSTIKLSNTPIKAVNGIVRPDRDYNVFWAGNNTFIEDVIFDGNEQAFRTDDWFVGGLRVIGNATLNNITVKNIRGSYNAANTLSKEIEVFGIVVTGNEGGSIIDTCSIVECPANSYVSGIYLGHNNNPKVSRITNCKVDIGASNWFGYSCNENGIIEHSTCKGPRTAFYNDTQITNNVSISKCEFMDVDKLISLIIPVGSNDRKSNVKVVDTKVTFTSGAERHLVELWDKNNNAVIKRQLGPVILQNVTVNNSPSTKLYVACVGNDIRPTYIIETILTNLATTPQAKVEIFPNLT